VAPLLARIQPGFGWRGNLRIGGQLELHAHHRDGIRASAELSRSSGDLEVVDPDNPGGPQRLGLAELRLALQGRDGAWALTQRIDGSNLGRLDGSQRVTARSAQAWPGRSDKVEGLLDLQVAQLGNWGRWLPAGWRLAGQLQTQARIGGRLGAPEFSGELVGRQIAVRNSLQGVNWTDARLRVVLEGEQARVDEFTVKAGAGTLTATGQARLGAAPRIDVALKADHFAAMQRIDRRVVVSGTAELSADGGTTRLKGRLRADEGRIDVSQGDAPGLADDVVVLRPEADAAAAATARERGAAPRGRRGLVLDLGADLGDNFELRGRGITTQLTGVLLVTSPNDKVALNGTITAVDGSYAAYGQKLAIDRGLITFTGPAENPRLDIQATRPDLDDVKVGVAITGTAQNPRVRLFSEPEMSNTDKLSWLLLGRASDGLGSTDLSLLQRAAFSLLAGESDSPSLVQRIGLDQFGVRQTEGTVRETIVTLGKQLSRRWYVGYERSLNAATGSWQLIYRLAQRFTLRAQSGLDNAVDLIWTWKWDNSRDSPPPADAARPQR
jgi:translocation and assembly module TamB